MAEREVDAVFIIADLAGYTALTEAHGHRQAAQVIARYTEIADMALAPGTRAVERVGDQLLIVADSAADAVQTAVRIREAVEQEPLFLDVRVGIHGGRVLEREGRYFGAALNLAARVAAHARAGQVLCTESIASALSGHHDFDCQSTGTVRFKNVPVPISIYEVPRDTPSGAHHDIDPVCQMQVRSETAPARLPYQGRTCYFCSFECARAFVGNPTAYVE